MTDRQPLDLDTIETRTNAAIGDTKDPQPDPLDENDHRDRADRSGRTWSRLPDGCWTSETAARHFTVAEAAYYFGPLTFADTPHAPQEAHNRTQTDSDRAALAEVAQAAHKLAEAIRAHLDGLPQEDQ